MDDPFVAALKHLLGDSPARRREVAKKLGASEQGLYQIVNGIPLKSGKLRSVGRDLRAKPDHHFPDWLAKSGAFPAVTVLDLRSPVSTPAPTATEQLAKKIAAKLALVPEAQREQAFNAAMAVIATFTAGRAARRGHAASPPEKRKTGTR